MQMPLQITFKNIQSSPAVEARVRQEAEKLERFSDRIGHCRVVIEAPHKRQRQGKLFRVSINLTIPPRHEIVIGRERRQSHAHEEIGVAIRDAFEAAARRIEDHARRFRGDLETKEAPLTGVVIRIAPDHGFIRTMDGQEVYFHANAVANDGFTQIDVGSEVRLVIAEGESPHGWQASTVQPIGKHHPN
jgi:cold shock CspA family protein/ribosome-associated translation inhibitor RaiA